MDSQQTLSILTISGSLRRDSFNTALLRSLPELAPESFSISNAGPVDLPIYNDDVRSAGDIPPLVMRLKEQIEAADGVVIASPEYNHSIGAPLKNALDWLSKLQAQPFVKKRVAILSAATGLLGGGRGQYHLRQVLNTLEARVLSKPEVFLAHAASKFEAGRLTDETARNMVKAQMGAFEAFLRERL